MTPVAVKYHDWDNTWKEGYTLYDTRHRYGHDMHGSLWSEEEALIADDRGRFSWVRLYRVEVIDQPITYPHPNLGQSTMMRG